MLTGGLVCASEQGNAMHIAHLVRHRHIPVVRIQLTARLFHAHVPLVFPNASDTTITSYIPHPIAFIDTEYIFFVPQTLKSIVFFIVVRFTQCL